MTVSKIVIDAPQHRTLTKPAGAITGWFAIHDREIPQTIEFRVGPVVLPYRYLTRPDVEGTLPEHNVSGFQVWFDLSDYLLYIEDRRLVINLKIPDHLPLSLQFNITENAMAACIAAASEG